MMIMFNSCVVWNIVVYLNVISSNNQISDFFRTGKITQRWFYYLMI